MNNEILESFKELIAVQVKAKESFPERTMFESRALRIRSYQVGMLKNLTDIVMNPFFGKALEPVDYVKCPRMKVDHAASKMCYILELVSYYWIDLEDFASYFEELFETMDKATEELNDESDIPNGMLYNWINLPVESPKSIGYMLGMANHLGIEIEKLVEIAIRGVKKEVDWLIDEQIYNQLMDRVIERCEEKKWDVKF